MPGAPAPQPGQPPQGSTCGCKTHIVMLLGHAGTVPYICLRTLVGDGLNSTAPASVAALLPGGEKLQGTRLKKLRNSACRHACGFPSMLKSGRLA